MIAIVLVLKEWRAANTGCSHAIRPTASSVKAQLTFISSCEAGSSGFFSHASHLA